MRYKIVYLSILLVFIMVNRVAAQSNYTMNGFIKTDNRISIEDEVFTSNTNIFSLKFEGSPTNKYHFFTQLELTGYGFPEVSQSSDLQSKDQVYSWDLLLKEAYFDLYQFGLEDLDVRIGRQIISWGTADALNPTNNISPDDMSDVFNFGEHLGSNAINASYYFGDYTINGIYIPTFTPAVLPTGNFASALSPSMDLPTGMILSKLSDTVILPGNKLSESSQYALKISSNLFDYDYSISYYKGRDDLPLSNKVIITPVDEFGSVNIETELIYPEIQVIGMDFAGSILDVGVWGEGAIIIPEEVDMQTLIQTPEGNIYMPTSAALEDDPYMKYVIGGDYTFSNNLYFNVQFVHGFTQERGEDNLNDYIAFRFEKTFFNDELKIIPFGGAIAINDWDAPEDNFGFVGNPEITYYPTDNVEFIMGAFWLEGKGTNMFSQIKDNDEIYLKAKVSF